MANRRRTRSWNQDQDVADEGKYAAHGWTLLLCTTIYLVFNTWTIVLSKWVTTGIWVNLNILVTFQWLDVFASDGYYCYLIPMTGPVLLLFVLVNWLGMKYFRTS
jgi:hypothetical protein